MKFFLIFCHLVFLFAWIRVSSLGSIKAKSLYIEYENVDIEDSSWTSYVEIKIHEEYANTYTLIAQEKELTVQIEFQIERIHSMIEKILVMITTDPNQILHVTFHEMVDAHVFYQANLEVKDDLSHLPKFRNSFLLENVWRIDIETFTITEPAILSKATIVIERLPVPYNKQNFRIVIKPDYPSGLPYFMCYPSSFVFVNLADNGMLLVISEHEKPIKQYSYFFRFISEKTSFMGVVRSTIATYDKPKVVRTMAEFFIENP